MLRKWIACVALTALIACPLIARAAEPTEEQKAAAMETLKAMKIDEVLENAITSMLDMQLKQNPQIAKFRGVMLDFFKKYMSWDALKDDMAKIYAEEFTVDELHGLTAFYKTPLGQKLASKQTILMTKGAELGQKRVQDHMTELQQAIQAEAQKNP